MNSRLTSLATAFGGAALTAFGIVGTSWFVAAKGDTTLNVGLLRMKHCVVNVCRTIPPSELHGAGAWPTIGLVAFIASVLAFVAMAAVGFGVMLGHHRRLPLAVMSIPLGLAGGCAVAFLLLGPSSITGVSMSGPITLAGLLLGSLSLRAARKLRTEG